MVKTKTRYICQTCGHEEMKWLGRCPGCGNWNSLVEEIVRPNLLPPGKAAKAVLIDLVELTTETRSSSGSCELDRVLGGGVVKGSFVLVGGDPGIGKSTLLLQTAHHLSKREIVLYVSGEESVHQIKLRANRLGVGGGRLFLVSETNFAQIAALIEQIAPGIVIIDSIQTIYCNEIESAPGSVSQVRECGAKLMRLAKENDIPVFLVGHVTKEGTLAGPRVLEHMVDTVLYFEGDRYHSYRILRSVKNRFGATNEIAVFEMVNRGLAEINNPSELFLSRGSVVAAGAVVTAAMEGTRPLLVEVQALVSLTAYGSPRRMATGIDYNRVSLLLAVLDKKVGYNLGSQDVFVNLAGGVRIDEPSVDLAVVTAVASSLKDTPIPAGTVIIGEVGLTGEIRGVPHIETRVKEAHKLGFSKCIIPEVNVDQLNGFNNITIIGVSTVQEALTAALEV